jgi:hypothetical protein
MLADLWTEGVDVSPLKRLLPTMMHTSTQLKSFSIKKPFLGLAISLIFNPNFGKPLLLVEDFQMCEAITASVECYSFVTVHLS